MPTVENVSKFQHYTLSSPLSRRYLCELQRWNLIECTLIFGLDELNYKTFEVLRTHRHTVK